ncbi:MAG: methyltransferase domain-containing protein [Chloroflexi bacterium]|jgi:SAM-dependent methyltransferase|nr:methyltransferase domain-containing protein [Chloroflexota bacterium]MBT3670575.1 methyltransferase domain-containing protein [Chloroflexota bacterium]MBT4002401.1 methyltransferase domain-containing protein [Chloroflexota bacterium]MBT4304210.1 methyltransferase domain-containing protein [Chloroflexota bacterium]MBT4533431.1 methyltransferase domain-containing protein [Chloroflexota bacterium]
MDKSSIAFTGTIPEYYDKYFVPIIFEEYAENLAGRVSIPDGGNVLEIAAGTGVATKHLRDKLSPNVQLVITDINPSMLEKAKSKFSDDENMIFQKEDASNLSFADNSFDTIISQFSMMFFPDKLSSLIEAKRVLKLGGKYIFNIWDSFEHNHVAETIHETVLRLSPNNPIKFFDVPYSYYQIDEIKRILYEAGFGDITISVLPRVSKAPDAKTVAKAFIEGSPVSLQIIDYEGLELADAVNKVERAISKKYGTGEIEGKMQAIVFEATLPN